MRCRVLLSFLGLLFAALGAQGQQGIPFAPPPTPIKTTITNPDGSIRSGLDKVKTPYSGAFEFGLNGSEGNSEVLKIRLGADFKYETPDNTFIMNAFYGLARQQGIINENKALITARNEVPFAEALSWFTQAQYEYDDFRAVQNRIAFHSGISYLAMKSDTTELKLRAGAGAAREIGGPNDRWIPEAQFGFDWNQQLSDNVKFISGVDYYPDISDFGVYRIRARAAIEIGLNVIPGNDLALRLGMQDRYDSRPGNAQRNDLDYFVTLLWRY